MRIHARSIRVAINRFQAALVDPVESRSDGLLASRTFAGVLRQS